jgi:hypothetical protein
MRRTVLYRLDAAALMVAHGLDFDELYSLLVVRDVSIRRSDLALVLTGNLTVIDLHLLAAFHDVFGIDESELFRITPANSD